MAQIASLWDSTTRQLPRSISSLVFENDHKAFDPVDGLYRKLVSRLSWLRPPIRLAWKEPPAPVCESPALDIDATDTRSAAMDCIFVHAGIH